VANGQRTTSAGSGPSNSVPGIGCGPAGALGIGAAAGAEAPSAIAETHATFSAQRGLRSVKPEIDDTFNISRYAQRGGVGV